MGKIVEKLFKPEVLEKFLAEKVFKGYANALAKADAKEKPVLEAAYDVAKGIYVFYLEGEFQFFEEFHGDSDLKNHDGVPDSDPVNGVYGLYGKYGPAKELGVYNDSGKVGHDIIRFDGDLLNLIYNGSDDLGYTKSAMAVQSKFHELMDAKFGEGNWDFSNSFSVSVNEDAVAKVSKKKKKVAA